MRRSTRFSRALVPALLLALMIPSSVLAQEEGADHSSPIPSASGSNPAVSSPSFTRPGDTPEEQGGLCAPWHRCIAWAGLGLAVMLGGALMLGYMIQSKGFDKVEHRQGSPEGVRRE